MCGRLKSNALHSVRLSDCFHLKTKDLLRFPSHRMRTVGLALEELLVEAQRQNCLVVGLYESAKVLTA